MDNILDLVSKNHGISLLMQHAVEYLHHPGVAIIPLKEDFISAITLPAMTIDNFLLLENCSGIMPKAKLLLTDNQIQNLYFFMTLTEAHNLPRTMTSA